jgi:predicted 2-oxoglutarate/Fe(II)-dependent dioxygenase YbiX
MRSQKKLSKPKVIKVTDVVRICEELEAREWAATERHAQAAVKQAQALPQKSCGAIPKKAIPSSF